MLTPINNNRERTRLEDGLLSFRGYFFRRVLDSLVTWVFVLILNFLIFYGPYRNPDWEYIHVDWYPSHGLDYLKFVFMDRFGPYQTISGQVAMLDHVLGVAVPSLILLGLSLAIAITIGIFLGTLASYMASTKHGRKVDVLLAICALATFSLPVWWVGLILVKYLFPPFQPYLWYSLNWSIYWSPWSNIPGFILDFLNHLFLPLLAFILTLTGIYFLVTRNSLRKVYTEDYMLTAKAKGCSPLRMMFRHALKNAAIPVISIVALTPPLVIMGLAVNEGTVFSRSGLGQELLQSTMDTFYGTAKTPTALLQALFIVFATIIIALHFIVDISVRFLDPRIRADGAGLERPEIKTENCGLGKPFHRKVLKFFRRFMKGYSGKLGLGILLFFAVVALIVPYLPIVLHSNQAFGAPSLAHLLGTDEYGNDILYMVLWGTRDSLAEGLGAVALALTIGYLVGLISGYYSNRWVGYVLDRATDVFLAVPIIVLAVYFPDIGSTPAGVSPLKWILAIGLTTWTFTAKLVRAEVISAKHKAFVEASRASGAGDFHIVFRSLFPYCVPAAASSMPLLAVTALTVQSSLDFLGFGRSLWSSVEAKMLPPYWSWGTILGYHYQIIGVARGNTFWWIVFPPAICIALLVLALIAIGNKVMEVAYPRLVE
jgi:peptide/nickel transport system permease protein